MEWKNYWSTHKNGGGALTSAECAIPLCTRTNYSDKYGKPFNAFEFRELKSE